MKPKNLVITILFCALAYAGAMYTIARDAANGDHTPFYMNVARDSG